MFHKIPNFGKVKINNKWVPFDKYDVISCNIVDNYYRNILIEKPIMSKYKIISQYVRPTYQNFMNSEIEVESDTHINAFKLHCQEIKFPIMTDSHDVYGYIMNMSTLEVFNVCHSYHLDKLKIYESFNCKLEKPKMKKFKVIDHNAKINYDNFMASGIEIKGENSSKAYSEYCQTKIDNFTWVWQSHLLMNIETLDVFLVKFDYDNGKIQTSCEFKETLEKPKPKINKYKIILNTDDKDPSFETMMRSSYLIEAESPKMHL